MLTLYNSLTKQIEEFIPQNAPLVKLYACGPTVYSFATIGNFRTYSITDFLIRTLRYNKLKVKFIMNITDVGHLTGDNLGDADLGEDRMEISAAREGKTAVEIAQFYTQTFLHDFSSLQLIQPERFVKATEHIKEQIELIFRLEKKGYTYQTSDGIYFDTSRFPSYGALSSLDQIKEGARVEINPEKRNPRDFALWKFSPVGIKRQMEWESPWGIGFPGWHIECSAMSMKYLGQSFDIHTGGMDLKETHHPNEIAQSEAVTGKKFVNYWLHVAFMLVNGEKMSKSKNNTYRIYDLEKEGYEPLALRYLYLQTHYRQEMNFTFQSLEGAQNALNNLRGEIVKLENAAGGNQEYEEKFRAALNHDLNLPEALSVVWELLKSDMPEENKLAVIFKMDEVLGLNLKTYYEETRLRPAEMIPQEVMDLVQEREQLRRDKQFTKADHLRNKIKKLGYEIKDTSKGIEIKKIPA